MWKLFLTTVVVCILSFVAPLLWWSSSASGKVFSTTELWTITHPVDSSRSPLLYLVVLGEVYDVSSGEQFYAAPVSSDNNDGVKKKPSQGYHIFIGQDSSASFSSGDWETAVEDVRPLGGKGAAAVVEWRSFYRKHKTYHRVGVLQGLYYDAGGNATRALGEVEALAARHSRVEEAIKQLEKVWFPHSCAMSFVTATKTTTISCSEGRSPYLLASRLADSKKGEDEVKQWCACLTHESQGDAAEDAVVRTERLLMHALHQKQRRGADSDSESYRQHHEDAKAHNEGEGDTKTVQVQVNEVTFAVRATRYEGCGDGEAVCVRTAAA